jgi:tyrosinase
MSHFVVTGATGGIQPGGTAPNRLEINDLVKNTQLFSLYIQALSVMFQTPQSNQLSHFGLGGIHGLPYTQWEGSGGSEPVSGSEWGGYCTHGSVLFPTWHRPYMLAYEQLLNQHAVDIANTYQVDKENWVLSAQQLRLPYWDWAKNAVPPPEVISSATVNIVTPDGQTTAVDNPLIQYPFNPIDPSFPAPYSSWQTTIRHPDDPSSPDATTDVQGLVDDLNSIQGQITENTYRLLTRVNTWPAMSNHTAGDGGSASNSLEGIHDTIHGYVGGQMGDPNVAAFDPIFFLHHANVDRMLSLWHAINPSVWVTSGPAEGGTWTISGNAKVDKNTNLAPFWKNQTTYWASTQTTTTLTYSYPEFNNLPSDPASIRNQILGIVNQLYGGGGSPFSTLATTGPAVSFLAQPAAAGGAKPAPAPAAPVAAPRASAPAQAVTGSAHPFASRGSAPQTASNPGHGQAHSTQIHDWTSRVHFKKYELGKSLTVLLFLGDVPADPSSWRTAPNFVGSVTAFVNSTAEHCQNCQNQADSVYEGFVHLNTSIAKLSGLPSYEPAVVSPYLQSNLNWRVQGYDRSAVPLDKLPSLEVTVASVVLTQQPGDIIPAAGEPQYHHHITHGRQGGAHHAHA